MAPRHSSITKHTSSSLRLDWVMSVDAPAGAVGAGNGNVKLVFSFACRISNRETTFAKSAPTGVFQLVLINIQVRVANLGPSHPPWRRWRSLT